MPTTFGGEPKLFPSVRFIIEPLSIEPL
ncbi:hypothetical protein [Staphylococcus aureus]